MNDQPDPYLDPIAAQHASEHEPDVPQAAITAADLCRRWRDQAAEWNRMAAIARQQTHPDYAMAQRREYRAEVYESCAAALEAAAPHITAAERDRIRRHAQAAAFTLTRPGNGPGLAHAESMAVVPLEALLEAL